MKSSIVILSSWDGGRQLAVHQGFVLSTHRVELLPRNCYQARDHMSLVSCKAEATWWVFFNGIWLEVIHISSWPRLWRSGHTLFTLFLPLPPSWTLKKSAWIWEWLHSAGHSQSLSMISRTHFALHRSKWSTSIVLNHWDLGDCQL